MQKKCFRLFLLLLTAIIAQYSHAQRTTAEKSNTFKRETIYIFGVSQNLNDSLVYVSEVVELKNCSLNKKDFLVDRKLYAEQFRAYVENAYQSPRQTAAVFFSKKPKELLKKWQKVRKKNEGQKVGSMILKVKDVAKEDFSFRQLLSGHN